MFRNTFIYIVLLMTSLALTGCDKEKEQMKWVDLRYDVPQDAYTVDAAGTQTVSIRVKSTDPWTVFGSKGEDWYTISPESGDPGEIYTVTISCVENTSLDDRCDTINVKSDYWTGKQFLLTQKGTAYLEYEAPQSISREGVAVTIPVLSNQDWTASVISGESWLSISEGLSGNGDGSVKLEAALNSGEQRGGEVALYDRNGVLVQTVTVTQDGVVLSPSMPSEGDFHKLYSQSQELRIPVESNVSWTVAKKQPSEETWYEFSGGTSFDGTSDLIINVSEYPVGGAAAVRTGTVLLSSVPEDGGAPIVKTIVFKQASPDANRTQTNDGQTLDKTGLTSQDGLPVGRYTFYLAPFTAADCIYLYFFWQKEGKSFAELRFWLNTSHAPMKTELSCMPYCNDVNKWNNSLLVPFDNTKQVKIALDIRESDPDASGNTWIYSEWWLNDVKIAQATSDGIVDRDGNTDTWKVPFSDISAGGYFKIWAFSGSATLEKWEYMSHIDWE